MFEFRISTDGAASLCSSSVLHEMLQAGFVEILDLNIGFDLGKHFRW